MRVSLREELRYGDVNADQISRGEIVIFVFHNELLSINLNFVKFRRIIDFISMESSFFLK